MGDKRDNNFELLKLSFDWCKHVSTLSTGCILIMATFLEKLIHQPKGKFLVIISLISFLLSILGTFGVQFEHLRTEDYGAKMTAFAYISPYLMVFGFVIGILSLTIFSVSNI